MKYDKNEVSNAIKKKIFKQMAEEIIENAKENLEDEESIAIGNLINSDKIVELINGYKVGFDSPYAEDLEYGMEPQKVSTSDLYEWLEAKQHRYGGNLNEHQLLNLAKKIRKKIEEDGTKPHPYFRKAVFEIIDKYEK